MQKLGNSIKLLYPYYYNYYNHIITSAETASSSNEQTEIFFDSER